MHTTLLYLAIERGFHLRSETFLAKQSDPLIAMVKKRMRVWLSLDIEGNDGYRDVKHLDVVLFSRQS